MTPGTSPVDYVILAVMLTISLAVGVFHSIRSKKASYDDYLFGERKLHFFPVTLSLFVTFMSSTSLIGGTADGYTKGAASLLLGVGGTMAYLLATFTIIPVVRGLNVSSVYEYFYLRFNSSGLRMTMTVIGMLQRITYTSLVLLSPALSLQTVAGIPFWVSVAIVCVVGIIYTAAGGIRGVVLADVVQAVIIVSGIMAVLIKVLCDCGGLENAWNLAKEGDRVQPVVWNPDPRVSLSVWTTILGGTTTFFSYTFDQSAIQRICGVKTTNNARLVYVINSIMVNVYWCILVLTGMVAFSYFVVRGCDPFAAGILTNKNQVGPYLVMSLFEDLPGMTGVYLATIFSGALSTVSSMLNGLSANTVEDILKHPISKYSVSERAKLLIAKSSAIFFGTICIGLTFLMRELPGTFMQTAIAIQGTIGGPTVGIFILGALVPQANKIGAFVGFVLSILLNACLAIGAIFYAQRPAQLPQGTDHACSILTSAGDLVNVTTPESLTSHLLTTTLTLPATTDDPEVDERSVFDISYYYYSMNGILLAFIIGLLVSLLTQHWDWCEVDEKFLFPCVRRYLKKSRIYKVSEADETLEALPKDNKEAARTHQLMTWPTDVPHSIHGF